MTHVVRGSLPRPKMALVELVGKGRENESSSLSLIC